MWLLVGVGLGLLLGGLFRGSRDGLPDVRPLASAPSGAAPGGSARSVQVRGGRLAVAAPMSEPQPAQTSEAPADLPITDEEYGKEAAPALRKMTPPPTAEELEVFREIHRRDLATSQRFSIEELEQRTLAVRQAQADNARFAMTNLALPRFRQFVRLAVPPEVILNEDEMRVENIRP